ncbi:3-oxoacyl-ACP synthase [Bacillus safensis]|uniref:ketoacyl-ACP synthase III n=1 Tax=Bacillus TaxID=1386 RepID=UPI00094BC86D|nr:MULTISPECIES: ketoacyl-ACP synthase III [Bacillus]APT48796.1 3-oxoacyl-ACP synthase [Bacillus safensis]APT54926.1 3-oxoacyl-ACP synthase [Bacillus safensis]MDQ0816214.1 3-oxoacyl-[acyl-carrier-protein] synthase-3 [Bacillus pumilus]PAC80754.1 ketoacyl-ACP synthase III [Bacillus sp. 7788]PRS38062.1 ketoacyl-ACP synthase III [Bacillus sp. NMCC4]
MMSKARITAIGTYVPEKKLTNFELEQMVETSNDWIIQRTGIHERRITRSDEFTSDLCVSAVKDLMHRYNKKVEDVDMIIVATSTPDFPFPSVSSIIQDQLNINQAGAIDLSAACAGFVYALHTANGLISSGLHKKVLVIGADTISKITDYADRSTCILFGDGAGAVLVERDEQSNDFIGFHLGSDGRGAQHVYRSGLSKKVNDIELIDTQCLVQNGREVFRWVVRNIPDSIRKILEKTQTSLDQVDWFIPHSANLRLIEPICEKLEYSLEKTLYSLVNYGNTSAATIPLALDLGIREGKVKNGDRVLMYGFGSGLVHAGQLLEINFDQLINAPTPL